MRTLLRPNASRSSGRRSSRRRERLRQPDDARLAGHEFDVLVLSRLERQIDEHGVSFHQHDIIGSKMARKRLQELRYPNDAVDAVSEIIRLHHRFHGYEGQWTDSAVRRYVRDAGPLLRELNLLVRADCTTRNQAKARKLAAIDQAQGWMLVLLLELSAGTAFDVLPRGCVPPIVAR